MIDRKDNTEREFDPQIYEFKETRGKPPSFINRYKKNRFDLQIGLFGLEGKHPQKTKSLIDKAISLAKQKLRVSDKDIDVLYQEILSKQNNNLLNKIEKSKKDAKWVAGIELSQPKGDRD